MKDKRLEASNLIEQIMERDFVTQKSLAALLGVSTVHLSNVYNGKKEPSQTLVNLLRMIQSNPKGTKKLFLQVIAQREGCHE